MEKIILAGLFLYLILFPFGQLVRLPFPFISPEVNLYLTDLVVGTIGGLWLIWRLFKKGKENYPLAKPILAFVLVAGASLLFNTPLLSKKELVVSSLYLVRWLAYASLYFMMIDFKQHFNELKWNSLMKFLIVIGGVVAFFGLVQYFFWPNLKPLEVFEWDPHYYRVVSTFLDPGFTGLILVFTLILLVSLYWGKRFLSFHTFLFIFVYLALSLTYSRSSYLAFLVGMGIIAWLKKKPKFFLVMLLLVSITFLVIPQPAGEGGKLSRWYSIEARIKNWQNTLTIALDHPLLGVGFNAYRYSQRDYGFLEEEKWQVSHAGAGADSSLLFVLVTTGILGLTAYLWLLISILKLGWEKRKTIFGLVVLASFASVLSHSFFLNSLFYPWIMAWWWLLLAKEYR